MPLIERLVGQRPTYGYRRITAVLNRLLQARGLDPVNHKRVYRIMKIHDLLLERSGQPRPERSHDGKVVMIRSNLRWCSDGLEFTCWNGEVIRLAFIIDASDREVIGWTAVSGAERWSREFGSVIKVDRMTKETIQNGKEEELFSGRQHAIPDCIGNCIPKSVSGDTHAKLFEKAV